MARFFSYGRKGLFTRPRFITVSLFSEQLSVNSYRLPFACPDMYPILNGFSIKGLGEVQSSYSGTVRKINVKGQKENMMEVTIVPETTDQ